MPIINCETHGACPNCEHFGDFNVDDAFVGSCTDEFEASITGSCPECGVELRWALWTPAVNMVTDPAIEDLPRSSVEYIEMMAEEATERIDKYDELDDDQAEFEAMYDVVEEHYEKIVEELSFTEMMEVLDKITDEYDVGDKYETDQLPIFSDDWRNDVITGYAWHIIQAAVQKEIDNE